MKSVDVKSNTYVESSEEIDNKYLKFKIGDNVRISKYKNVFAKGCTPNWSGGGFVIKKVENTVPRHILLMILMEKKLLKCFVKKNCKKQIVYN